MRRQKRKNTRPSKKNGPAHQHASTTPEAPTRRDFEDGEPQYLVANIGTVEGKMLATSHGVGHVTLLLFDGQSWKLNTPVGSNTSRYLTEMFRGHLSRSTKS